MKISAEANELPSIDLNHRNKASQQEWEQLFLKKQGTHQSIDPRENRSLPEETEHRDNTVRDKHLFLQPNSKAGLQDDETSTGTLSRQHSQTSSYSSRYDTPALKDNTRTSPLAQTVVMNKIELSTKYVNEVRTVSVSPERAYELSRGLLQKDSSGEATLWVGNVDETLLRKSLTVIKRYLEAFSIRLTRLFFRGEEINMGGCSYRTEDTAKDVKPRIKNG